MKRSFGFKRTVITSCFIIFLISGSYGQKALPVYDGINYTAGTLVYDNTNWWCLNPSPVNDVTVTAGSLSYPGLLESTANKISISGDGDDFVIWFGDRPADTKVYYSFIFQVTNMAGISSGTYAHFAGFTNTYNTIGSFGCSIFVQKDATDFAKFNIGHFAKSSQEPVWNQVSGTPVQYSINTPILVVGCYEIIGPFINGTPNDKSSFWINPLSSTFENTLPPTAAITSNLTGKSTNDLNPVTSFYILQDAPTNTPAIDIDEVRIGSTWASVTPKSISTGTKDIYSEKNRADIYPNPVNDILKVDLNNTGITYIEVYDPAGLKLLTKKVDQGITNIDVKSLPQGIYIISFKGSGGTYNRKFIKK